MSMLGDVIAEHFRLKAERIRLNWGLGVMIAWLIACIGTLIRGLIMHIFILTAIDAPRWLWWLFWVWVPVSLAIEHVEQKDRTPPR